MEQIYQDLYSKVLTKSYLADEHQVSTKTIENRISILKNSQSLLIDKKDATYITNFIL